MRVRVPCFAVALAACVLAGSACAGGGETLLGGYPEPTPGIVAIDLREDMQREGLAGRFYVFEDPARQLTFSEVRSPEFGSHFVRSEADAVNLGFTTSAVWLRLDLQLNEAGSDDWMLTFDYPGLDRIEVYDGAADGHVPAVMGDRLPFSERLVPLRTFAMPLRMTPGHPARLFVRVVTDSSMQVRPGVRTGRDLYLQSTRDEIIFGGVYGVMALMGLYNLFLFFAIRDRSYLVYAASTLFGVGFLLTFYGHAAQYLWPDAPGIANWSGPVCATLWGLAAPCFARLFLTPERYSRFVARVIQALVAVAAAAALVAAVAPYRVGMMTAAGMGLLNAVALPISGAIVWRRGHRAARFFTVAWMALGVGVIMLSLSRFGVMADTVLTTQGAVVGAVLEVVLLSLALSDKYRLIMLELEGHSRDLEARVAARTSELAAANTELARLSLTDALTSLANRREFDTVLREEIERHRRSSRPVSLAMVDVDAFKSYNHRYGHPQGDDCLRRIAALLTAVARRPGDRVARYGGEQFAIILPDTDATGALEVADRIRDAVREAAIPHAANLPPRLVTVSVGVGTLVPGPDDEPSRLVERADGALYEAKRSRPQRSVVTGAIQSAW